MTISASLFVAGINIDSTKIQYPFVLAIGRVSLGIPVLIALPASILVYSTNPHTKRALLIAFLVACLSLCCGVVLLVVSKVLC